MRFAPVPAREHAIVWEIRPEEARGALFEFGMEQRIMLRRTWRALRGAPLPSFFKLKQFRKVPVVVSLHPDLARTFILPFRTQRKKAEGLLQPETLQGMLREFLAKATFEMRRAASEALGVEELDAILLDARLTRVFADGSEVRDDRPIEGRTIEGSLQVILTTRAVFQDLHDLLHSGRELFFAERGPAALAFLGRHAPGAMKLLDIEAKGGWLFSFDPDADEVIQKVQFHWDAAALPEAFAAAWGVSRKSAEDIYAMFLEGGFSDRANRFAAKLLAPLEEDFDRVLAKAKVSGQIYLRTTIPLPLALPASRGGAKLLDVPQSELLERSGLIWDRGPVDEAEGSILLMPFLEYYYHRGDPRGHKVLTRHIHWISA